MKQKTILLVIAVIITAKFNSAFGQATQANNVRPATAAYNGWDGTGLNPGTLEIRNDFNSNINFFTNTTQKATILSDGKVGFGTTTVPKGGVGYAKFALEGTATSSAGPHLQFTTSADNYPVMQQLNWTHDNVSLNFDSYYDGAWRSATTTGGNFQIYKQSGKLNFNYGNVNTQGSAVTFSTAISVNTSGNVGIGTTSQGYLLDVNGDINAGGTTTSVKGYRLGTNMYLWNNANTTQTLLGMGAGATSTGNYNTAVGNVALGSNTTTIGNTAIGYAALTANTANSNTACGRLALTTNTIAYGGSAFGAYALRFNTIGCGNTAMGESALQNNTTAEYNAAFGDGALFTQSWSNSGTAYPTHNVAVGHYALFNNQPTTTSNGYWNTAIGSFAGYSNTTGLDNVFTGYKSGYSNTTGYSNTCVGVQAGDTYAAENKCTFVGYDADANANSYTNSTAIGNGAVSDGDGYAIIGNTTVNQIGGWLAWTNKSDGRFKTNVQENVKGLEFIKMLRPVTYQMDTQKGTEFLIKNLPDSVKTLHMAGVNFAPSTSMIHSGFIAQEVEQAANSCNFISSIVSAPADTSNGSYGISYAEIVVPLVKAVQELSKTQDSLLSLIAALQGAGNRNNNSPDDSQGKTETIHQLDLATADIILYEAEPNPFTSSTTIRYFIPETITGSAYINFLDMYGREVNKLEITERGFGKIEASTENLASGIYSYSIVVDGKTIDTKKMLKTK